jgi:hypothetical protein
MSAESTLTRAGAALLAMNEQRFQDDLLDGETGFERTVTGSWKMICIIPANAMAPLIVRLSLLFSYAVLTKALCRSGPDPAARCRAAKARCRRGEAQPDHTADLTSYLVNQTLYIRVMRKGTNPFTSDRTACTLVSDPNGSA